MNPSTLRKSVLGFGIALILSIITLHVVTAWQDRQATLQQRKDTLHSFGKALAEQTTRMIQEVDLSLTDFAVWHSAQTDQLVDQLVLLEMLRNELGRLPFIQSATVVGANGRVQASTREHEPIDADWSGRNIFVQARQGNAGLYIGLPRTDRGHQTIALSRALRDRQGHFAGIVIARVSLDYLNRFYAAVAIAPDAVISLMRNDGVILASHPQQLDIESNRNANTSPAIQPPAELAVQEGVADYPLAINITQPHASALQAWRQQEVANAIRTAVLALFAAVLITALVILMKRRDQEEQQRLQLEDQLHATQQAETLGLFAASLAHDFNNVLSVITGYAEIISDNTDPSSPAGLNAQRLHVAGERARQLVRRMLTFDRHRGTTHARLDVSPVVHEVLEQIRATLPDNIALHANMSTEACWVRGDATELHQVVMNLCTNAIQAMPHGGTLSVTLKRNTIVQTAATQIGSLHPGEWIALTVSDTGTGITPDILQKMFQPFFTTKRDAQGIHKGAGIGLTVVSNVMTSMGGAISVTSTPAQGTSFQLWWPALPETQAMTANMDVPLANGQTIMIVDDNEALVRIAEELLATHGYEPVGFTHPEQALAALRNQPERFDAVLSDENMPAQRGSELAQAMRAIKPSLLFVLMTGHLDAGLIQRARQAGIEDILEKPLNGERLRSAFSKLSAS